MTEEPSNVNKEDEIRSSVVELFLETIRSRGDTIVTHELQNNVVQAGANFCSGIAKLIVESAKSGVTSRKSYLLKIPALSLFYNQLSELNMYTNEITMYNEVLPEMYTFWNAEPITATNYLPPTTDNLVLDDLTETGYRGLEKKYQLDLDHATEALKALAKLHALSVKLYETSSQSILKVSGPPKAKQQRDSNPLLDKFANTVALLPVPEKVFQFLRSFRANDLQQVFEHSIEPNEGGFDVLCHGDFWNGNVLFQHGSDGRVRNVKIVDFQLAHRSSPVVDIMEFVVTSVRFEVYEKHRIELLNAYLSTLNSTLVELKCRAAYTEAELKRDWSKYRLYIVYNLVNFLPSVLSENEDPFNFAGQETKVYDSQLYRDAVVKWLCHLVDEDMI